jgi:hypothetical protein
MPCLAARGASSIKGYGFAGAGKPNAPTGVSAQSYNNQSAPVSFTAPLNTGGAPITSYIVTSSPGGLTATGLSTTLTVTGLTNGTSYTFTVKAVTAVGQSVESQPSNATVPAGNPGAPTIISATPSNGQVSIQFSAPSNTGGIPITNYSVNYNGNYVYGTSSPIVVTGLSNGTQYTFSMTAYTSGGLSGSGGSISATPSSPISNGQQAYTSAGTYSWVAPAGVTSVSVVCVGAGGGGGYGTGSAWCGAAGGNLRYVNNITVVPATSYTVVVGSGGTNWRTTGNYNGTAGGSSTFNGSSVIATGGGPGGGTAGTSTSSGNVGSGGNGGAGSADVDGGGGGAGGYSGNGGAGSGNAGAGGGGAGGSSGSGGYGGGGVGLLGQGASGASANAGGSGGNNGGNGSTGSAGSPAAYQVGGFYGGGGGAGYGGGPGANGAVRIIWGNTSGTRAFPSTNTGNL